MPKKKPKMPDFDKIFTAVAAEANKAFGLHNQVTGLVTKEQVFEIYAFNDPTVSHPVINFIKVATKRKLQ